MDKRKICVVTGSRAEYGLLYWVMREIRDEPEFQLQVISTGMHLSPEFGLTYKTIENDGFVIDHKVDMLLSSDSPVGITKSIGLGVLGFADAYDILKPDMVLLLGDRFEIFAAAQAALPAKIPVAHIAGGDTTEGAFDELIRHSITKMAHLHFTTNEISSGRLKRMGENPNHVFTVGSPGIDYIKKTKLLSRDKIESMLDFKFGSVNLLITFHPETLESEGASLSNLKELLAALDSFGKNTGLFFTMPNADTGSREFICLIKAFVDSHANAWAAVSLGQELYLSLMSNADAVVGNSSSGIYEAPSLGIPTVNIGDRQRGRLKADSVIDCEPEAGKIKAAIDEAFGKGCSDTVNPYGDGKSAVKIVAALKSVRDYKSLLKKHFFDIQEGK